MIEVKCSFVTNRSRLNRVTLNFGDDDSRYNGIAYNVTFLPRTFLRRYCNSYNMCSADITTLCLYRPSVIAQR